MHFSLVLVQLDLVNLIPSFRLPGSGRAYACYCLLDDRVGVGLGVQPGLAGWYHESADGRRLVAKHALLRLHS